MIALFKHLDCKKEYDALKGHEAFETNHPLLIGYQRLLYAAQTRRKRRCATKEGSAGNVSERHVSPEAEETGLVHVLETTSGDII